jgi:hypothetical protein
MKVIMTAVLVLVSAIPAWAEWGLYANRDGRGFVMEKTFAFQNDCDTAARAAWRAAQQKGAFGCAEYSATSFANPTPQSSPQPSGDEPFGEKYRQSLAQESADRQRRQELQIERDKVRALEQSNRIEERKARAIEDLRWRRR